MQLAVHYMKKDKLALENVQTLAYCMATRSWDSSYQDLLNLVNLPSLECRRLETQLCLLYKIMFKQNSNVRTCSNSLLIVAYAYSTSISFTSTD